MTALRWVAAAIVVGCLVLGIAQRFDLFAEPVERWRLVTMDGASVGPNRSVAGDPRVFVVLTRAGVRSGRDGCNYWSTGENGETTSTLALCPEEETAPYNALMGAIDRGAIRFGQASPAVVRAGGHMGTFVRDP